MSPLLRDWTLEISDAGGNLYDDGRQSILTSGICASPLFVLSFSSRNGVYILLFFFRAFDAFVVFFFCTNISSWTCAIVFVEVKSLPPVNEFVRYACIQTHT